MQIQSLTPHLGAIVQGVDLSEPMSGETFQALNAVYLDWSVLAFPDQQLSQAQHKAFASRFGALHTHPMHARQQKGRPLMCYGSQPMHNQPIPQVKVGILMSRAMNFRRNARCFMSPRRRRAVAGIPCLPICTSRLSCSRIR